MRAAVFDAAEPVSRVMAMRVPHAAPQAPHLQHLAALRTMAEARDQRTAWVVGGRSPYLGAARSALAGTKC